MFKRFKKQIFSVFTLIAAISLFSNNAFAYDSLKDIIQNESESTGNFKVVKNSVQYNDLSRKDKSDKFDITIKDIVLKNQINTNEYMHVYKIDVKPRQERDWGFLGMGSHGNNYYNHKITTTFKLKNTCDGYIKNYQPKDMVEHFKNKLPNNMGVHTQDYTSYPSSKTIEVDYKMNEHLISEHKYEGVTPNLNPILTDRQVIYGSITIFKKRNFDEVDYTIEHNVDFETQFNEIISSSIETNYQIRQK